MSIEWFLYLADILPNFGNMFGLIGDITFPFGIAFLAVRCIALHTGENFPFPQSLLILMIVLGFIFIIISDSIPSEKTIYLIAGARELKQSNIPTKVEAVIEKKLDEYLKDSAK